MTSLALKFGIKLPILKIRKIWSNFERLYLETEDEIEKFEIGFWTRGCQLSNAGFRIKIG